MNITQKDGTVIETGCYVDGHWGHYAGAHMIMRATEFGYSDEQAIELAQRRLNEMFPHDGPGLDDDEYEVFSDCIDDAEAWLNDHAAPEGYSFGWFDGEFYLWSNEDWEQSA